MRQLSQKVLANFSRVIAAATVGSVMTGCGSAISAFVGAPPPTAQVVPQLPSRWSDGGMTISSGRTFSSSPETSADVAMNARHRVLTSSTVSADISMNQSRGKLKTQ